MAAPLPSNLDFEQCIRGAYIDATGQLRVNAQISAPLDVNGEVLVDIRAEDGDSVLLAGTTNGSPGGTVQYIKVNPDGSINVTAAFSSFSVSSVDQGAPNSINNAWPVKLTDGTDTVNVNPDGSLNIAPIKITDGTDLLSINPDGSLNVANVTNIVANTATLTNIASSTSSQIVLAVNTNRKGFILFNDSTANCYVAFASTASSSSYTMYLNQRMTYQNEAVMYTGVISAIWDAANGFLRTTELI